MLDRYRSKKKRNIRKLKTPEKITPRLVEEVALAAGINVEDFFSSPQKTLDAVSLTIPQMQAVVDAALLNPKDIRNMPIDEAEGYAYYVLTDFFLRVLAANERATNRLLPLWKKSGQPISKGRSSFMKAFAPVDSKGRAESFLDYMGAYDGDLEEVFVYWGRVGSNIASLERQIKKGK